MPRTPGFFHRLFKRSYGAMGITHQATDAMYGLSESPLWIHTFFATNITDTYEDNVGTIGVRVHPKSREAIQIFEFKVKPAFFANGVATAMLQHILLTYRTFARKIIINVPKSDVRLQDFFRSHNFMLVEETSGQLIFVHYFNYEETHD